ncbi:gamma-glutamylcyclotransferase family protein [Larkinella punicea]|uniref:Gamma-glutamylcyclotransferase n=1 Tax=Larkinella punicea TaxID=2315727 RepID=A0A368JL09_9BACT|nr:gamma-glutamylcyclotransferase family protein [Larkinella punicea]RCR68337.1 gamma-glutamylcyclotransferase [Larkinella punicea]
MSQSQILYFAYGPNMLTTRLQKFVSSAEPFKKAYLEDFRVVFNKKSRDQSAQVNIQAAKGERVEGMLFSINDAELPSLDKAEKGYRRKKVLVIDEAGKQQKALTYISKSIYADTNQQPFNWYKSLMIAGSQEHKVRLDPTIPNALFDLNLERTTENLSVLPQATIAAMAAQPTAISVSFDSTISVNGGAGQTFFGSTKVGNNTVNTAFTVNPGDFLFVSFVIKATNGTKFTITYSCKNTATGAQFTDQDIPPHPSPISDTVKSGGQAGVQIKLVF